MKKYLAFGAAIAALVAGSAYSAGSSNPAVAARQAQMKLQAFYLGPLGAMAQGKADYDAAAAQMNADNLAAITGVHYDRYWAAGTDSDADPESKSLPALFENLPDVAQKAAALHEATLALQAAAGGGLDALKAAIGPVGGSCGGCHKAYRVPNN